MSLRATCGTPTLFDTRVHTVACPIDVSRHAIAPRHLAHATPARVAQFVTGRACARTALRAAGANGPLPVGVGEWGAPTWPPGFVGSIAHTSRIAWAAAASTSSVHSIGIDVEEIPDGRALHAAAAVAIDAREAPVVGSSPIAIVTAFSAKESLLKCLAPIVGERFDFTDARIVILDPRGRFRLVVLRDLGRGLTRGLEVEGRFAVDGGVVFTFVVLERGELRLNPAHVGCSHSRLCCSIFATSADHPVWCDAPSPAPVSAWKYS